MRPGSFNALVTGAGLIRPFKGLSLVNGITGSRTNFLTDDGFVGLGDADVQGFGVVFKAIDLLFFMGGGALVVNGIPVLNGADPVLASTQFQYLKRDAGAFTNGDDSHRYDVGHPRPSIPNLYAKSPPSPGQKPMNAVVAMAIWRADSNTGQPSLPSESVNVTLSNASVIVQFPEADENGQDVWGIGGTLLGIQIGNIYELPTSRDGEVLETLLAYTRTITCSINDTETTLHLDGLTPIGDQFTSADIGRRIRDVASNIDTWITGITDAFTAELSDAATSNVVDEAFVITHAVDGYERAIEVSYSDDDLLSTQTLAPYQAFEPMDGRFAGFILDVFFIEDVFGTIFYSIPGELSFPRINRRIYTEDKATVYINTGRGDQWRIAPQSISKLYYLPSATPIQLDIKARNIGCKYPTNACLGYDGRLMVWSGRPSIIDNDGSFNSTLSQIVATEFEGWEDQTEEVPVVTGYDPLGLYELWCHDNKIMATHAPTGRWCSPVLIDAWCGEGSVIVSSVIVNERLRLVVRQGDVLSHFEWNVGEGSDLVLRTYARKLPSMSTTITEVQSVIKAGDRELEMTYTLIGNFDRRVAIGTNTVPAAVDSTENQVATSFRPDFRGIGLLEVEVSCENADGHAAVDFVDVYGEWNESFTDPKA